MAPITRSRLRRQRIEDNISRSASEENIEEIISISSASTSASPLIQPQPLHGVWQVIRRNDTSVSLSFDNERMERISEWLARVDSSDASTISNGAFAHGETQPFDASTISNGEVEQYDDVEVDVVSELNTEPDDDGSEQLFIEDVVEPLTFCRTRGMRQGRLQPLW